MPISRTTSGPAVVNRGSEGIPRVSRICEPEFEVRRAVLSTGNGMEYDL